MDMTNIRIDKFQESNRDDFYEIHSEKNGCGWCYCVAWWVPTWDGWGERTAEENRRFREDLLLRGEYDGYLLYHDSQPVGWCQVGRVARLEKVLRQFSLTEDDDVWAITCFLIAPTFRRTGLASQLLQGVIDRLERQGVEKIMAFPKKGEDLDENELWNGPASMFRSAGFDVIGEDDQRWVLLHPSGFTAES
jgi:GNAT superfamily N-acetyltransferase